MQLRTAHDLGHLIQDARLSLGWSQSRLAEAVGVSRQWISLVENGKTSVEFDLVLSALHVLGYAVHVERGQEERPVSGGGMLPIHVLGRDSTGRTALTRKGKPLGHQRSRRDRLERDAPDDE